MPNPETAAHHLDGIRTAVEQLTAQARRIAEHLDGPRPESTPAGDVRHREWLQALGRVAFFDDHIADEIVAVLMRLADTEQRRTDPAGEWRRKAVRRAIRLARYTGAVQGLHVLAGELDDRTEWGDGYRAAVDDLRELLGDAWPDTDTTNWKGTTP